MNEQVLNNTGVQGARLLGGGGEMGRRIREMDWAQTPLPAPEEWPQSLQTAVRIALDSRYPMVIWWGDSLVNLYNDAYAPILGNRHPKALGQPARDVWHEIWGSIGGLVEAVMVRGEATWNERTLLVMERYGFTEEAYFTFSYSPAPDDEGGIGGLFCAVTEDTARVLSERRMGTLRLLGETMSDARTVADVCASAAEALSQATNDLPYAQIYLMDGEGKTAQLAGSTGEPPANLGETRELDFTSDVGCAWSLDAIGEGRVQVLPPKGRNVAGAGQHTVLLPLLESGKVKPLGFIVAGTSPMLMYGPEYEGFLELIAGAVADAVIIARSFEQEKARSEALAELDMAKSAFFSNVSHEFRTPLTLMLGPLEELLADSGGATLSIERDVVETVFSNAQRLLKLVNSLLDFSRIEARRSEAMLEPVDLPRFTRDLASMFRSAVEKAGMSLVIDCEEFPEPVPIDAEMWEKIVLNLLSNAFKYTADGEIRVSLRKEGQAAVLRVSDTGIGIAPSDQSKVFERFQRIAGAQGRTHEGTGIGLALVQELTRLHGGTAQVESEVGKGSTFIVSIPLGGSRLAGDNLSKQPRIFTPRPATESSLLREALSWLPEEPAQPPAGPRDIESGEIPAAHQGHKQRIILADDNSDLRSYVLRMLTPYYDVEVATNGRAALDAVHRRRPDLVLTDIMMPVMDGIELLEVLRDDAATATIPVIMLSARAGEDSRVDGLEAGADDYLIKPFSARELLARIAGVLALASARHHANETLRESEERFRNMADNAPVMVWVTDGDGSCTFMSKSWYEFTGQQAGAGLEVGWLNAVHPADRGAAEAVFKAAHAGKQPFRMEYRLRRWDGRFSWALDAATPRMASDGTLLGYIGSVIDITERKKAEDALRDASARKDEFLATLAHELRNPLAPLRNGLQIIALAGNDPAAMEEARRMMERQLRQMVRLIDELLDLSRISRGHLQLKKERVPLANIIQSAIETTRPLIEADQHELIIDMPRDPIMVDADATRLSQVFANLLGNAAKYTERHGDIRLTVQLKENFVSISVKDNGIGIPSDMLSEVFEMFRQVDKTLERAQSGLGIGLTIVKQLVDMHGGTVEAASDGPGAGSEFTVRLPTAMSENRKTSSRPMGDTPAENPLKKRILVVDDNEDSALSMAMILKFMGNETKIAYDGVMALQVAEQFRPDFIFMDIGMPKLNGYDACHLIRENDWAKDIVVVALTGWGQEEDRRRSFEAGFNYHLVKPVEPDSIEKVLAGQDV